MPTREELWQHPGDTRCQGIHLSRPRRRHRGRGTTHTQKTGCRTQGENLLEGTRHPGRHPSSSNHGHRNHQLKRNGKGKKGSNAWMPWRIVGSTCTTRPTGHQRSDGGWGGTVVDSNPEQADTSPRWLPLQVMTTKDIVTPGIALERCLEQWMRQGANPTMEDRCVFGWNRKQKSTCTTYV